MAEACTLDDVRTRPDNRRSMLGRRIAVAMMLVVVGAGATGFLGVRSGTAHDTGGGYDLSLTYPRIARAGLDIPWELRLTHPGGFPGKVTIALTADYFDIFEFQGMHPSPSDETSTGEFIYLTFEPPPGDEFRVALDTYVQPSSQIGRDAEAAAIIDGTKVASVHYTTWLVP